MSDIIKAIKFEIERYDIKYYETEIEQKRVKSITKFLTNKNFEFYIYPIIYSYEMEEIMEESKSEPMYELIVYVDGATSKYYQRRCYKCHEFHETTTCVHCRRPYCHLKYRNKYCSYFCYERARP